jgi:hypothetical protein
LRRAVWPKLKPRWLISLVLSQQTNDLLRRLLVTNFSNFAHVEQNSAKASGSSALQPNGRN